MSPCLLPSPDWARGLNCQNGTGVTACSWHCIVFFLLLYPWSVHKVPFSLWDMVKSRRSWVSSHSVPHKTENAVLPSTFPPVVRSLKSLFKKNPEICFPQIWAWCFCHSCWLDQHAYQHQRPAFQVSLQEIKSWTVPSTNIRKAAWDS